MNFMGQMLFLPVTQPTVSKRWRNPKALMQTTSLILSSSFKGFLMEQVCQLSDINGIITTTVLQPLCRLICVSRQLPLTTRGFCWSKVSLPVCCYSQQLQLEMWANAKRDGRPAEHRWRPLFNAAMFGWCPLLECRAVTLPRRGSRWK